MNLLEMADPGPVTSLRARLSVQPFTAQAGCDTSKSEVNAALLLSKFKDGAPTTPGDRTNDVVATVFAFNPGPDVPIAYGALGITDTTSAGKDLAAIAVTASSAGCSTGTNVASLKAAFDEIRTNVPTIVP